MSSFNDPDFLYSTAEQLASEGKFAAAELMLRQAVELGGEKSELYAAGLATLIGLQEGRAEESAEYLKGQLLVRPENPNLLVAYGLTQRAAGNLEEAEKSFRSAVGKNPEHPMALHSLSKVLVDQGQVNEAEKLACKAFALVPDHPEFAMTAIELCEHTGKPDVAYEIAALSASLNPQEMDIVQKAVEGALARRQPDRAWEALKESGDEQPWVIGWKATLLDYQGKHEEADELLEKGRQLFGDDVNFLFLEAAVWVRRGIFDRASPIIDRILEKDPTNKGALKMRSDMSFEAASIEDAIRDLEKVQDLEPEDPDTALDLISAYYTGQRYQEALELCLYWGRMQKENPALYIPPQIHVYFCLALAAVGETEEALAHTDWILDDYVLAAVTELTTHGTGSPGEERLRDKLMARLPEPPLDAEDQVGTVEQADPATMKASDFAGVVNRTDLQPFEEEEEEEDDDDEYIWIEVDEDEEGEEYVWVEVDEDDEDPDAEYEWVEVEE